MNVPCPLLDVPFERTTGAPYTLADMATWIPVIAAALVAVVLAAWASAERARRREARAELETARIRASALEARLESAREGLEALAEGVIVFDPGVRVAYANGAARELLGRRVASASDLAPADLRTACRTALEKNEPAELEFETAGRTLDAAIVPGAGGVGGVLLVRDVTSD